MTLAGSLRFTREADRIPDADLPIRLGPLDLAPVLGRWCNANRLTWGIWQVELTERDGQVWARVWGVNPAGTGLLDWGEAPVERLYTDGPRSNRVCGYTATFDLGHARTQIQANQGHGVTILAAFTTFTDDSGRCSYMSREYYHRGGGFDHD